MTNRYMTPLRYKNGLGQTRHTKLFFELAPVELADWVIDNPFEANELAASLEEMKNIHEEDERDLTTDEVQVMLGIVRLLAQISAGRPTDDGEYFLKDPNWISSYAYREFRVFLMTHPNEMNEFLKILLDNEAVDSFNAALNKANAEAVETPKTKSPSEMTEQELRDALAAKSAQNVERQQNIADNS